MKKNYLYIILAIILSLVAAYLWLTERGTKTLSDAETDFAVEDTASIDQIFLADKEGNQVTLERQGPAYWTVNEKYQARQDAIDVLLRTIHDIKIKAPVGKKAEETIIRDMSARSTKVEIYQDGDLEKTYYVGTPTQDHQGTYMMQEIDGRFSRPFITHIPGFPGFLSTRYFPEEYKWKSTALFRYSLPDMKSVKVEFFRQPEWSYEIIRHDDGRYSLKSLKHNDLVKNFDTLAVKQYLSQYRRVHFETYQPMAEYERDSILNSPKFFRITITGQDGDEKSITAYRIKAEEGATNEAGEPLEWDTDRMFARINDEEDLVYIQYMTFDFLLRPIGYFETDPTTPKSIYEVQ